MRAALLLARREWLTILVVGLIPLAWTLAPAWLQRRPGVAESRVEHGVILDFATGHPTTGNMGEAPIRSLIRRDDGRTVSALWPPGRTPPAAAPATASA